MKTKEGMKVIEYNSRFGDPETQVVLPMLKGDLLDIFEAVTDERLSEVKIGWEDGACVCVVLASGGYPVKYEKGKEIEIGEIDKDVVLYHAGHEEKGRKARDGRRAGARRLRQGQNARRGAPEGVRKRRKDPFRRHVLPEGHRHQISGYFQRMKRHYTYIY